MSCVALGEPAARGDIVEFGLVDARVVRGFAIAPIEDDAEDNAGDADDDEHRMPAIGRHQHEQERAEEGQADIFADGIDACRRRAFLLRKPGPHDPAVGREARRLGDAEAEAVEQQDAEAGRGGLQQREQRPERQGEEIRDPRTEPVEENAAGNLHSGVGPGEGGEHDPHRRRVDSEIGSQGWSGDAKHSPIKIVDHRGDGDEREDPPARSRRLCRYLGADCGYTGVDHGVLSLPILSYRPKGAGLRSERPDTSATAPIIMILTSAKPRPCQLSPSTPATNALRPDDCGSEFAAHAGIARLTSGAGSASVGSRSISLWQTMIASRATSSGPAARVRTERGISSA